MNKQQLIAKILSKLSEDDLREILQEDKPKKKRKRRGRGHRSQRRKRPQQSPSPLLEPFVLTKEEQEEMAIAEKDDAAFVPTQKTKRPSGRISVTCRVCHKTEMVSTGLVTDTTRYKCNKCSCSACG